MEESLCVNTDGGFFCNGCLPGFTGQLFIGDESNDQTCFDIDECSIGMCDQLTECNNTLVNPSYP